MYLTKIIEHKRTEVAELRKNRTFASFENELFFNRKCFSLKENLQKSPFGIIAEFKRKSPSKGFIHAGAEIDIVKGYEQNGASGVSVLADRNFFAGSPDDVQNARKIINIPILFKEFVIDEIQILQAKSSGADVVLLIAAALTPEKCAALAQKAKSLGLETLLEIHSADELAHIGENIDMVGINNRNLQTFEVDLQASVELCHRIPERFLKISESGISSPETVKFLKNEGFSGFLMGENFMKEKNPAEALKNFISQL